MDELKNTLLRFFENQGVQFVENRLNKNMFNYKHVFRLSRSALGGCSVPAGLLLFSEQSDDGCNRGLMFSLSGVGCQGVDFVDFFRYFASFEPKITRIDIAVDYLLGEITIDDVLAWYRAGVFAGSRGFNPSIDKISRTGINDEKRGGYTLGIGRRNGTRYVRAYEKAYELSSADVANPFPNWFRFEFELHNNGDATIPINCCEDFDSFLASVYPKLVPDYLPLPNHSQIEFYQSQHLPLIYSSPTFLVSLAHLKHYAQVSYGALLNIMRNHLKQTDSEIVQQLIKDDVPRRLQLPVIGNHYEN